MPSVGGSRKAGGGALPGFTPEESARLRTALSAVAAGGYSKKDLRAQVRQLEDSAFKIEDSIRYSRHRVELGGGKFTWRSGEPMGYKKSSRFGGATEAKRDYARAQEMRRKAELYQYVLDHGDFPKGYRR